MSIADQIAAAPRAPIASEATAIEQARAIAEVAAAVRVARDFPRDESTAMEAMRRACSQLSLADKAFYSLPRASGKIEGSTVHLMREISRCWGNLDYGIRELRRDDAAGHSEMQAWAWDQQTNVRPSRSFIVPHAIMASRGKGSEREKYRKNLVDLADIANNNNSVAARALRETIRNVLPVWYVDEAERVAWRTLQGGGEGKPLPAQIADAVAHFEEAFDVPRSALEEWLGRRWKDWTAVNVGALRVLAGELSRGEKLVESEFGSAGSAGSSGRLGQALQRDDHSQQQSQEPPQTAAAANPQGDLQAAAATQPRAEDLPARDVAGPVSGGGPVDEGEPEAAPRQPSSGSPTHEPAGRPGTKPPRAQMNMLFARLDALGVDTSGKDGGEGRRAVCSVILARRVDSFEDLSRNDVSFILDTLKDLETPRDLDDYLATLEQPSGGQS